MKFKFSFILCVMLFHTQIAAFEEIKATKRITDSYVEIELAVPIEKSGQIFESLEIGFYQEGTLILYTEVKGRKENDNVIHLLRVSGDVLNMINVSVIYGDGLLCDALSFNYKLKEMIRD